MANERYTKGEFEQAVTESASIKQALTKLGVVPAGGNYAVFHRKAREWGIDISHFSRPTDIARSYQNPKPASFYLRDNFSVQSDRLRRKLLNEGYFQHKCSSCGLVEWCGLPIPLELDHIDGNPLNNLLVNLRMLCPNCHAQTDTYRGKNVRDRSKKGRTSSPDSLKLKARPTKKCNKCDNLVGTEIELCYECRRVADIYSGVCVDCQGSCVKGSDRCMTCHNLKKSEHVPTKEDLLEYMTTIKWNFSEAGRHYEVSDNAVRKWCKKYDIVKPT